MIHQVRFYPLRFENQSFVYLVVVFRLLACLHIAGNVYISDLINQVIRKVTVSTGIIDTIAGTGTSSYSGDNGPATSAALYYPQGVVLDTAGRSWFHRFFI